MLDTIISAFSSQLLNNHYYNMNNYDYVYYALQEILEKGLRNYYFDLHMYECILLATSFFFPSHHTIIPY